MYSPSARKTAKLLKSGAADFKQKGPKKGQTLNKLFPSSLILGKSKNCIISHSKGKHSFFLKPKFFQKVKITEGPNFFTRRPNFSSELAEKFCQELAT
jgi:hypothetical protein